MSTTPIVTIFVRHTEDCKNKSDEFFKRCNCRKHLRWTHNGTQYRRAAGTRAWSEAETAKRDIEDQLSGRPAEVKTEGPKTIDECVTLFLQNKDIKGVSGPVLRNFKLEIGRFRTYCESKSVFVIQGVTGELLTGFCATWKETYPSSYTRSKVRERLSGFLNYCFESQWIPRKPPLPSITVDSPPTMPVTDEEYARLLKAVPTVIRVKEQARARALIQLMRYSGLAIRDAVTLKRDELNFDETKQLYRVVTSRQKTGTDVSVPIPPAVAAELKAVPNDNPEYFFWDGKGDGKSFAATWGTLKVTPVFDAAEIPRVCQMVSHRLRDTFAVDLLKKGVPLEEVSKLLGHESIRTTEKHYAKWIKGRQDRLDTLVMGTWAA